MNRIALVEDHQRLATLLTKALRNAGIETDVFDQLAPALLAATQHAYAVLVIDRGLPDGDGLDLVRQLRAAAIRTPCLMLTSRDALHDRVEGLESGADDYLTKPFSMDEFVARVRIDAPSSGAAESDARIRRHPGSPGRGLHDL